MTRNDWTITALMSIGVGFGVIMGVIGWGPDDVIKLMIAAGLAGTGLIVLGVNK